MKRPYIISIICCLYGLTTVSPASERTDINNGLPTKSFGTTYKIPINKTCIDGNYLRTKSTYEGEYLYESMSSEEQIDIGNGRVITLSKETPKSYRYTLLGQTKTYELTECSESRLSLQSNFQRRDATAQERLVLGALYQRGITEVRNQAPSIDKIIKAYRRGGPTPKEIYFETDQCAQSINSQREELLSLGGEGSGKGKVVADININLRRFESLRLEPNRIWGLIPSEVPLSEYVLEAQEIPSSIIGVHCR